MKKIINLLILVAVAIVVFALASSASAETMYVTGDHVRVRLYANTNCDVMGHYDKGETVKVVSIENGWALLESGYYIKANFLTDDVNADVLFENMKMYVTGMGVRERSAPDTSTNNVIAKHNAGEFVIVTGKPVDGWYQTTNGGYISEAYLSNNYDDVFTHLAEEYKDVVVVSVSKQHAMFSHFGQEWRSDIVTGQAGQYDTPLGLRKVTRKAEDFFMNGNSDTYVEYATYFTDDGLAIHDADHFPWRTVYGGTVYKTNGSHGCVNTPVSFSEIVYRYARVGYTYVIIIE